MSYNIKPCPFCGENPHLYQIPAPTRGKFVWKVMCHNADCCAILNDYDTREQAIEAWNRFDTRAQARADWENRKGKKHA